MLGLTNILVRWDILCLLLVTFLGYLVAKINPKVSSLLMSKLPAEKLASTSSFLGLMVSFAMPLGTALSLVSLSGAFLSPGECLPSLVSLPSS